MAALSYCGNHVRRYDPDRYLTALFLPHAVRERVFALYAFNAEIARAREVVSEIQLAAIRLQWWREAIGEIYAGHSPRAQPIVEALAEAINARSLPADLFKELITAREADLEPPAFATIDELARYARATAAPLQQLAALSVGCIGEASEQTSTAAGTAWALTGLLRAVPYHARAKRLYLPHDLLAAHEVSRRDLFELRPVAGLPKVVQVVANSARQSVVAARLLRRRITRQHRAVFLPVTGAAAYLRAMKRVGYDPFAMPRYLPSLTWRLALARSLGRY